MSLVPKAEQIESWRGEEDDEPDLKQEIDQLVSAAEQLKLKRATTAAAAAAPPQKQEEKKEEKSKSKATAGHDGKLINQLTEHEGRQQQRSAS